MTYDFKLTKNPDRDNPKTVKGSKRVFNFNGSLLCFLKRGKLYDLNAEEIAPCARIKGSAKDEIPQTRGYCEDGKKVYFYGEETGLIEKRDHFIAILLFLIGLTAIAILAMTIATCVSDRDAVKEVVITDKDGRWEAEANLDIFGKELLKPSAKGEYLFTVYNPNGFDMEAELEIGFTYGGKKENLPIILYALTVNGKKVELIRTENGYAVKNVKIEAKEHNSFMLAWEWEFDGNDEEDTEAGVKGEKYVCEIYIIAEQI